MATASSRNGTGVLSPYTEEDEPNTMRRHARLPGRLEHRGRTGDVGPGVADRVGQRRAHSGLGRQVHDDGIGSEQRPQGRDIQHVLLPKGKPAHRTHLGQIALLHGPGVEGIEVVDPDDLIALGRERLDQMGADEARGPCHQNPRHRRPRPIP